MKASKKSVEIDYLPYDGDKQKVIDWVESFGDVFNRKFDTIVFDVLRIKTLEGTSYNLFADRDIIIRGVEGEYYPCRKDIFYKTYDV